MKTILYSSTRQWNPGDEFVYFGIRRLLRSIIGEHNAVLFNRHPFLLKFGQPYKSQDSFIIDNSWMPSDFRPDYIIFKGPEWSGEACSHLYSVADTGVRFSMLGVGCSRPVSDNEMRIIRERSDLVITRDQPAADVLSVFSPTIDVCPSIFVHTKLPISSRLILKSGLLR